MQLARECRVFLFYAAPCTLLLYRFACACIPLRALAGPCRPLRLVFLPFCLGVCGVKAQFMFEIGIVQSGEVGGAGVHCHGDRATLIAVQPSHGRGDLKFLAGTREGEVEQRIEQVLPFLTAAQVVPIAGHPVAGGGGETVRPWLIRHPRPDLGRAAPAGTQARSMPHAIAGPGHQFRVGGGSLISGSGSGNSGKIGGISGRFGSTGSGVCKCVTVFISYARLRVVKMAGERRGAMR